MSVKPGVIVKEFNTSHNEPEENNNCLIRSGGVYGIQNMNQMGEDEG